MPLVFVSFRIFITKMGTNGDGAHTTIMGVVLQTGTYTLPWRSKKRLIRFTGDASNYKEGVKSFVLGDVRRLVRMPFPLGDRYSAPFFSSILFLLPSKPILAM